jgi:16S rRNA (guanine1207-N2)-methyltransferase
MEFSLESLSRVPDVEAANLFAVDAADRLLLDTTAALLRDSRPGSVAIVGDNYGALALGATALHGAKDLRVHQDPLIGELALSANARRWGFTGNIRSLGLDEQLLAGAELVLLRLPKGLDALDETAAAVAHFAEPGVRIFAGGMVKHMTLAQNQVLERHFGEVSAGLARQKARVLSASRPLGSTDALAWPRRQFHQDLGLWVCAHGSAFAGSKIDIGTRFLLSFLAEAKPEARDAVDLGCGTGVLAASLAKSRPEIRVLATDQSAAAVASARATAEANNLADRVTVSRDDGLRDRSDASVDLVLLNPPFHLGTTVHTGLAERLIADAARVLRPGGELWTVFNSHLDYQSALRRLVGSTRQAGRNPKFTVTVSTKR